MATKLKKMRLSSVDLVRAGANQEADICLFKSADGENDLQKDRDEGLIRRFIRWLRSEKQEEPEIPEEDEEPEEEDEEPVDPKRLYGNALKASIESIMDDPTLNREERSEMIGKSISQYQDFMDSVAKADRYDDIEEI